MSNAIAIQKKLLRQQLRERVAGISESERKICSARMCELLRTQSVWKTARSIFFYSPIPGEPDISSLASEAFEAGKIVLFPKFDPESDRYLPHRIETPKDLLPGKFGIREPNGNSFPYSVKQLDLTLVPALGFDLFGRRLGRGRGFYDKLLVEVSGAKCGVAFDEQVVSEVPVEPHDIPVDCLLTPTRWIVVSGAKFE